MPTLGVTLDINDALVGLSYSLPGFVSFTNGTGDATASAVIPNDPFFAGLVISSQAVAGNGTYRVSNLVRLTPQASGTFVDALNQPSVPVLGGGTAVAPNNELLFVGGSGPVAQRYKSRTEEWELAGASLGVGLLSQTTGLADGRVLFTGGIDVATGQPTTTASIYDPVTQTTTTLAMAQPRAGHGASLMNNGRVLISGGSSNVDLTNPLSLFTGLLATTELFDPVTNTFLPGPTMLEPRAFHTSTTLTTGRVLVAGGIALLPIVNIPNVSSTAYLFNPTTNSFGLPSLMSGARFLHTATALSNGRVLLVGGLTLDLTQFLQTGQLQDLIIGTPHRLPGVRAGWLLRHLHHGERHAGRPRRRRGRPAAERRRDHRRWLRDADRHQHADVRAERDRDRRSLHAEPQPADPGRLDGGAAAVPDHGQPAGRHRDGRRRWPDQRRDLPELIATLRAPREPHPACNPRHSRYLPRRDVLRAASSCASSPPPPPGGRCGEAMTAD